MPVLTTCSQCGYVSSQKICKACMLLEGLNRGLPKLGIGKSSKAKRILAEDNNKHIKCSEIGLNQCCQSNKNSTTTDKSCMCNGTAT